MQSTARDLRFKTREILATVERGEEVVITRRGQPAARIVPMGKVSKTGLNEKTPLFGIWKGRKDMGSVQNFVRTLRKGRFDAV